MCFFLEKPLIHKTDIILLTLGNTWNQLKLTQDVVRLLWSMKKTRLFGANCMAHPAGSGISLWLGISGCKRSTVLVDCSSSGSSGGGDSDSSGAGALGAGALGSNCVELWEEKYFHFKSRACLLFKDINILWNSNALNWRLGYSESFIATGRK